MHGWGGVSGDSEGMREVKADVGLSGVEESIRHGGR